MGLYDKITITQSAIKSLGRLDKMHNPDYCDLKFILYFRDKEEAPIEDIPRTWLMGLYFEQYLIGANRSGKLVEIPHTQNGPSKDQVKCDEAVRVGWKNLTNLKVKIFMVQPELDHVDDQGYLYEAHLDVIFLFEDEVPPEWESKSVAPLGGPGKFDFDNAITWDDVEFMYKDRGLRVKMMDVKFSDTSVGDEWNGWGDPQSKMKMDGLQPKFYSWLFKERFGYFPEFYYYVQGQSDKNWVKWIKVDVYEQAMVDVQLQVIEHKKKLKKLQPKGIGRHNICKSCEYFSICPQKTEIPELISITLGLTDEEIRMLG